ncbi:MAG: D-amino acid dehydrogenase [Burkholderiaceae bacterium]|nr:D-amino acid dehydrogenase [Burkholderiaceae bacterium]
MHVVVIGAGIIGVTTAYCLRRQGCEVTVLERRGGVAREASFANGGVIAPGYTGPWAAPGAPGALLKAFFRRDAALRLKLSADRALWRWLRQFVAASTLERYRQAKQCMYRLARYSQEEMHTLQARHAIDFEQHSGLLQVFRSDEDLARHAPLRTLLTELGAPFALLTSAECRALEPALNEHTPLAGGVRYPNDETGNCAYFARRLKEISADDGVRYTFDSAAVGLDIRGQRLEAVITERGALHADACVIAAGTESAGLLAATGIRLPLLPVKGYSATVPIARHDLAPRVGLMDERFKVAVTRMGNRLRIAGTAVLGEASARIDRVGVPTLLKVAGDWYPGAAGYNQAQWWAGARPTLPDGPPVLGRTPITGLYLNAGHGSSGWAMACGAARVLADLITGQTPGIDLDGLTLDRFARPVLHQGRPALQSP